MNDNDREPWWVLPALIAAIPVLAVIGFAVEAYNWLREWAREE